MISALSTFVEVLAIAMVVALFVTRSRSKRQDRAERERRDDT